MTVIEVGGSGTSAETQTTSLGTDIVGSASIWGSITTVRAGRFIMYWYYRPNAGDGTFSMSAQVNGVTQGSTWVFQNRASSAGTYAGAVEFVTTSGIVCRLRGEGFSGGHVASSAGTLYLTFIPTPTNRK